MSRKTKPRKETIPLAPLSGNLCGKCTACCTLMGVKELDKPAFTTCTHLCASGCAIYQKRPGTCRGFQCSWLLGDFDVAGDTHDVELRPDNLGAMFFPMPPGSMGLAGNDVIAVMESKEGGFEEPVVQGMINAYSARKVVLKIGKETRKATGPARMLAAAREIVERIKREQEG